MQTHQALSARMAALQLCVAFLLACNPQFAAATDIPAEPGAQTTTAAEIGQGTGGLGEPVSINQAFRQSSNLISSSNLVATAHDVKKESVPDQLQVLFKVAQQQHRAKDYGQALQNFTAIVEGKAADEMKRAALIEMAVIAQEQDHPAKAQQILSQYLRQYPQDPGVPEVLLRQGLLLRQMGAPALALSKFYAVMTSSLSLKQGSVDYYQHLVLQAQTEIADTFYLEGKHEEAFGFFSRLLKQDAPELNKPQIQFKALRCQAAMAKHSELIAQAEEFLARFPGAGEEPEVRFLLATSLKQLGRNKEALQQVLLLLKAQQATASSARGAWVYWQQRAGNQIANQMYQEADYLGALEIYSVLGSLDKSAAWQLPVWYQVGLIYERLQQPGQAAATYARIVAREKELASADRPGLKTVVDMAKWRNEFLGWQSQAEQFNHTNAQLRADSPLSAAR